MLEREDVKFKRVSRDPEEYGVFEYGISKFAHIRMSSGILIAEAPCKGGTRIYAEEPGGETVLKDSERPAILERFRTALWHFLKYGEAWI